MRIQVKDFMSSPVITAIGENNVREIRAIMKEKNIHAIPVISNSKNTPQSEINIRGIITTTDINKEIDDYTNIEDIMIASNVYVVHEDSSAQAAAKMMLKRKVHHIVVMDDGKITGMISALDFVKLVAEHGLG